MTTAQTISLANTGIPDDAGLLTYGIAVLSSGTGMALLRCRKRED